MGVNLNHRGEWVPCKGAADDLKLDVENENSDVNLLLDGSVLFGMSFLFALLLFKTRGCGSRIARRQKGKTWSNLFREFPRKQIGG